MPIFSDQFYFVFDTTQLDWLFRFVIERQEASIGIKDTSCESIKTANNTNLMLYSYFTEV